MLNGLALCAGIGGLELGLSLALGEQHYRCVCYVEREGFAASTLVARMEDASLDSAPIWDDLTSFEGKPWRGVVDIVSAGYPCQPFSFAGKRGGHTDPRHLWPHVKRIIDEIQPSFVFLENVPGHLTLGFREVLADLHELGYSVEGVGQKPSFGLFSAEEVGATHLRERLFCLAYRHGRRLGRLGLGWLSEDGNSFSRDDTDGPGGPSVGVGLADSHVSRLEGRGLRRQSERPDERTSRQEGGALGNSDRKRNKRRGRAGERSSPAASAKGPQEEWQRSRNAADGSIDAVGNAHCVSSEWRRTTRQQGKARPSAGYRSPERLFPPRPNERDIWSSVIQDHPTLEPSLCRMAHGIPDRVDRLRSLGNGVVPLVAAKAFVTLARIAGIAE